MCLSDKLSPKQASSLTYDIYHRPLTEVDVQQLYYCFEKKMLLEAHSRLKLRVQSQNWQMCMLSLQQLHITAQPCNCLELLVFSCAH